MLTIGALIFNLGGQGEPRQIISNEEGRRIARRIIKNVEGSYWSLSYFRGNDGRRNYRNSTKSVEQTRNSNVRFKGRETKKEEGNDKQNNGNFQRFRRVEKELVYHYADKYSIMRIALWKMVLAESEGDIYAYNPDGPYWGLMQWRKDYYYGQAKAYGYKCPDIFNPDQHLDVSCRAISEEQEWRWPDSKHFLTDYYVGI